VRLFAKLSICATVIVGLALSLSGYLLISSSYRNAIQRETERALDEYQYSKFAVQAAVITNPENFQEVLRLDYDSQMALFAEDRSLVFSNLSFEIQFEPRYMVSDNTVAYRIEKTASKPHIMVWGRVVQSGKTFYLLVASDISSLSNQKKAMVQSFGRVYFLTLGISLLLVFVLAALLSRPINRLTQVSMEIAGGQYDKRICVSSDDEMGDLSSSFNSMADAIEEKIDELSTSARQKEDFVANFAHELKTPLTSIIGYADMIYQKSLSGQDIKNAASYIIDEGLRLAALSSKLMDLIVLERQDFILEEMRADEVLQNIVESLLPLVTEKAVELQLDTDPAYIKVDYDLFKTCILNLIDNSIKAGSTKIIVSGKRYGRRYCIGVADNGRGIPLCEIERITEAFYMVDKSRSRKQHGVGLGLSLVSRIAEIHGATLKFTSEEHKGTLVELNLFCEECKTYE
jgi:signal transduction histidine kinase